MKHTTLILAAVLVSADAAWSGDTTYYTPDGWSIEFTARSGTDPEWVSALRVEWIRDILDINPRNTPPTANDDYLEAYLNGGWHYPGIDGKDCYVVKFDEDEGGSAHATRDEIEFKVEKVNSKTKVDLEDTVGHELFHGVQYAYEESDDNFRALGDYVIEGHAKTVESMGIVEINRDYGASTNSNARGYLANTNQYLWGIEYDTALFWLFTSQHYGPSTDFAPTWGMPFMRKFWELAQAEGSNVNGRTILRRTLNHYGESLRFPELFRQFSVVNYARKFELDPDLPVNHSLFTYVQEAYDRQKTIEETHPSVIPNPVWKFGDVGNSFVFDGNLAGGVALVPDIDVRRYGAVYLQVTGTDEGGTFEPACTGVIGFRGVSDPDNSLTYTVLFLREGTIVHHFTSGGKVGLGDTFTATVIQDPASKGTGTPAYIDTVVVVATGVESTFREDLTQSFYFPVITSRFDGIFACGTATLTIRNITGSDPEYAGYPDEPDRIRIPIHVAGPPELGETCVRGLRKEFFEVHIGNEADPSSNPLNLARVISAAQVGGQYWLVVMPPKKPGADIGDAFDLQVKLGNVTQDIVSQGVIYDRQALDLQIVIDTSGSMNDRGKIDAAIAAGQLLVDAAQEDDTIGFTEFYGDDSEPNDDAQVVFPLAFMTSEAVRSVYKAFIGAVEALGFTSIGDGLRLARADHLTHGRQPFAESRIVLLSDGYENEPDYAESVLPTLTSNQIKVHSIALGPDSDQGLLQYLADETGGDLDYVPDAQESVSAANLLAASTAAAEASLSIELSDAFRRMFDESHHYERLWEKTGTGSFSHSFDLQEDNVTEALLTLTWPDGANPMSLTLLNPDEQPVVHGAGGAEIYQGDKHTVIHLDVLSPGTWTIEAAGTAEYRAVLTGWVREGVQTDLYFGQDPNDPVAESLGALYLTGLPMPVIALLTDAIGPILGAELSAEILHPDGTTDSLALFDDGQHYDGAADDGVYANLYHRTTIGSTRGYEQDPPLGPVQAGTYRVKLTADGTNNAEEAFVRLKSGAFHLLDHPELGSDNEPDGMPDRWEDRYPCVDSTIVDSAEDGDGDGLRNREEFYQATHPCHPDTDGGGESDGSEVEHGRNPRDPDDDVIGRLEDFAIISHLNHTRPAWMLMPNALTLWFGLDPSMREIEIYRREGNDPWRLLTTIDAQETAGFYQDTELTDGEQYAYFGIPIGESGVRGLPSEVRTAIAKADPYPPDGDLVINDGRPVTTHPNLDLALEYSSDTVEMRFAQEPSFAAAVWQPASANAGFVAQPDEADYLDVYAQFRDASGNESQPVFATIEYDPTAALGDLEGAVELDPPDPLEGLRWIEISIGDVLGLTKSNGTFSLTDLPAGTYTVQIARRGYQTHTVEGVEILDGNTTTLGGITLLATDNDADGLFDNDETDLGTDPNLADTDGDGYSDGEEVLVAMTDPLDPTSALLVKAIEFDPTAESITIDFAAVPGVTYSIEVGTVPDSSLEVQTILAANALETVVIPLADALKTLGIDPADPVPTVLFFRISPQ